MGNHVQMPRDEVGKLLVDFVEDLEQRFDLFFYGFDISYVDIQDNRLETFSYSTDKYLQVTEGGIKDKNVGSILRKESLHLDPAPDFYELGSEVNYALHEPKEYRLPFHAEFDKLDAVAASPELWGAFYKEQGFSGHFAIGGVIDEPFRYRLILFSVFDGLEKDKETLVKVYLANFIEKKIRGVIFTRFRETFKEMRNQATRAAISQIMARNMSHNIGSHVSYKSTNPMVRARLFDLHGIAANPNAETHWSHPDVTTLQESIKSAEMSVEVKLPILESLGKLSSLPTAEINEWIDFVSERLDKYEIIRNEYLADYDRSPQSYRFYQDVVLPFCENTLIMDAISRTEGAAYSTAASNQLRICVSVKCVGDTQYKALGAEYPDLMSYTLGGTPDLTSISYPHAFPFIFKARGLSLADAINTRKIDLDVDVLLHSEQGLYSILENYIRNAAKHNKNKISNEGLIINVFLEEADDRFLVHIYDNVSELTCDQLVSDDEASGSLLQRIRQSVNFGDGRTSMQNLGFADMCINSFLFRWPVSSIGERRLDSNLKLITVENPDTSSPIFQSINPEHQQHDKIEHRFGFQIQILKPRKILWIGNNLQTPAGIADWKNSGVKYFPALESYLSAIATGDHEIASFDFLVLQDTQGLTDENLRRLPSRRFLLSDSDTHANWSFCRLNLCAEEIRGPDKLEEICWRAWLDRLGKTTVYVYYDDPQNPAGKIIDEVTLKGEQSIENVRNLSAFSIPSDMTAVIYDHHGRGVGADYGFFSAELEKEDFYTKHSKIVFDKGSDDFSLLNYLPENNTDLELLVCRLIDAANTNVFILDERIAAVAVKPVLNSNDKRVGIGPKGPQYQVESFAYGNVFVLNAVKSALGKETRLLQDTVDQPFTMMLDLSENRVTVRNENPGQYESVDITRLRKDILVLHRTYLTNETLGMNVNEFLSLAERYFDSVIVTSGGGYPHTLDAEVRFIPFSTIERCVGSRLSKLKLVAALRSCTY